MLLFPLSYFVLEYTVTFHTNQLFLYIRNKVLHRGSHITEKCSLYGDLEVDRL